MIQAIDIDQWRRVCLATVKCPAREERWKGTGRKYALKGMQEYKDGAWEPIKDGMRLIEALCKLGAGEIAPYFLPQWDIRGEIHFIIDGIAEQPDAGASVMDALLDAGEEYLQSIGAELGE